MKPAISWQRIGEAVEFYTNSRYEYIEAPWIVGSEAYGVTKPDFARDYATLGGNLVASAEQSFIQMMLSGQKLEWGCAVTPCFRDEAYDELHLPYFVKLELIYAGNDDHHESLLGEMIKDAKIFFGRYLIPKVVRMPDGSFDIVEEKTGIELGSYGIRRYKNLQWIYGTGLAEPRLSQAIEKSKAL